MGVSISKKPKLVERLAHLENNPVPQLDIAVRPRAAQVEIAIAQARLFARRHFVLNLERRRLRVVQNVQARGHHFHFAGGDFGVRFLPANHAALDRHHKFRAQLFGLCVRFGMQLLVEHDLRDAGAVAQVNERSAGPGRGGGGPSPSASTSLSASDARKCAAVFCALQISESIEQDVPFRRRGLRINASLQSQRQPRVPRFSDSRYSSNSSSESFFCSASASRFSVNVPEATSSSPMISA